MQSRIQTLTDREKQTLRLLLKGHDAKSIARTLDLSVHTINERLRGARRKLEVASSREAARLLAETEQARPQELGDDTFGVTDSATNVLSAAPPDRAGRTLRFAWLSGGMFVMSLLIAAFAVVAVINTEAPPQSASPTSAATAPSPASDPAVQAAALNWLALIDQYRWTDSWSAAAALFRAQLSAAQWEAMVQPIRKPLGAPTSRTFLSATHTTSPQGSYEVVQFRTDFAKQRGTVETVTMARDGDGWRTVGYFIK
ncbi:helix-turn-helix domain-containing protein [Sphingomonas phyllosphaerae]|uniref:helix-turn-helix domain-containing protein n=1 Tax=Sphingomonas phyllosphaerae TaxID=257003 RepID=UPI0004902B07|nr:DUF4019 domain-containing protein [Sphingomonas phyllosphaerae]